MAPEALSAAPRRILLLNPNTTQATTAMMVRIARGASPRGLAIEGMTATEGVPMIVNEQELEAAAASVMGTWRSAGPGWSGLIVGAFGDPAVEALRAMESLPVTGLCEASMLEAGRGRRRFGVATVTPELVPAIHRTAQRLGLAGQFTGVQLTHGEPRTLTTDPERLAAQLRAAVQRCLADGAEAAIIGGGPLAAVSSLFEQELAARVVSPVPAAVREVARQLVR